MPAREVYGGESESRMIVDTGNLTHKHLICDKSFFRDLDNTQPGIPVSVANDQIECTQGFGTCEFVVCHCGNPVSFLTLH